MPQFISSEESIAQNAAYEKVNHRYKTFSNKPTGVFLENLVDSRDAFAKVVALNVNSWVDGLELRSLAREHSWESIFVSDDCYHTPGFGPTFRQEVNFDEVALAVSNILREASVAY